MRYDERQPHGPCPEQLAAYADGELDVPAQQAVERWLADHPDAAAEVEQYRSLARAWKDTSAPEPSPEAWQRALHGIHEGLEPHTPRPTRHWWGVVLCGLTAAAAVAALVAPRFLAPTPGPVNVPAVTEVLPDEEPFPVVEAHEVVVISMNPNDGEALVVAQPLELSDIQLVTHEDIEIIHKADPGIKVEDWGMPMIVDPLAFGGK